MSPAGTILREANTEDRPTLNALIIRVLKASNYDRKAAGLFILQNRVKITPAHMARRPFWVAEQGHQIVGCVSLDPQDGQTGQVRNFHVTPRLTGQGIGRLLWFRLLLVAQAQGFRELSVSSDPVSIPFYETLGFRTQRLVPIPGFRGCASAHMTLRL